MSYLKDLEPNLMDDVKHKTCPEGYGVVIAKYTLDTKTYIDVRSEDNTIWYKTPASDWEVTKLNDELEGI